ncbi:DUF3180 domain-containing protein [Gryllotalpicola ginsengisoli]|uniref:DUF3180 domain-containing protein n=1 Tax=Gryllotalpicola ginsengisoli TaxID=444608 RepID=UPI0003B44136|nr:DUF3180 domain-containing protein [Gryllotalpicola ginsengisoli]
MNRTHPLTIVIVALVGLVVGFLTDVGLTALGRAALVPPVTLSITLAVIGGVVVALAWPVRRAVKGTAPLRIDPFRAARTAVLAKASSVAGALFAGFSIGLLGYALTRDVIVSSGAWLVFTAVIGSGVLLACGLVAEFFCTLPPPSDGDEDDREPPTGATHSHA